MILRQVCVYYDLLLLGLGFLRLDLLNILNILNILYFIRLLLLLGLIGVL